MPPFSEKDAAGQIWLHRILGARPEELYVAFEQLGAGLMVVVSSERLVVFTVTEGRERAVLTSPFSELELARSRKVTDAETGQTSVVIELVTRGEGASLLQRPQVRCEGEVLAEAVCHTVNYARAQYEEGRCTVGAEEE